MVLEKSTLQNNPEDVESYSHPPEVPAEVYTREYFLTKRHGADEFQASGGAVLSPIHRRLLNWAAPGPGRKILDVGCGCGELVIHAALAGAEATGLDYSEAALALAREAAGRLGARARFHLGDVSELPPNQYDAILIADVVEHLHQHQLERLYQDLSARLAPGGRLIIHTWPNRWHTEFAYPIARILLMPFGVKKPAIPRKPHDEIMHVNEQSLWSLRHDLRSAGYRAEVWLEHVIPNTAGLLYRATHSWPMLRLFFADHLFAFAYRD